MNFCVFLATHPKSKKHNREKYVFYWPLRCAKFAKVIVLNKELYKIDQQQPYIDCFRYGAWFITKSTSQAPLPKIKFPRFY